MFCCFFELPVDHSSVFSFTVLHRWYNQQVTWMLCRCSHAGCSSGPYLWQQNRTVGWQGKWSEKFQSTTCTPMCPSPLLHLQQWPLLWISPRNCPGARTHPQSACFQVNHSLLWKHCHLFKKNFLRTCRDQYNCDIFLIPQFKILTLSVDLQVNCTTAGQVPRHPCSQRVGAPVWPVAKDGEVLRSHPQVL